MVAGDWQHHLQVLMKDKETRLHILFGAAFLSLCIASFAVSVWSNSLVLELNGFVLMHRVLLAAGACADKIVNTARVTHSDEGAQYSYGLQRFQVLTQFGSVAVLCFSCLTAVIEGMHGLFEAHDVHPYPVELLCLAHMATCLASTRPEARLRAKRRGAMGYAVLFLQECLGPVICFFSTYLIAVAGMPRLDVFFAMLLTVGTVFTGWESLTRTASILLQQTPLALQPLFDKALREVSVIPGVLQVREAIYWQLVEGQVVASLKLRLSVDSNESTVLKAVQQVMDPLASHLTVECDTGSSSHPASPIDFNTSYGSHNHNGCSAGHHGHSHSHGGHGHSHGHGGAAPPTPSYPSPPPSVAVPPPATVPLVSVSTFPSAPTVAPTVTHRNDSEAFPAPPAAAGVPPPPMPPAPTQVAPPSGVLPPPPPAFPAGPSPTTEFETPHRV